MQYTAQNGTKVTITHEAAGRIHSIRVKDKPPPKPTKIRIASPRMRATSPRVRAENISPTIISVEQEEMVHLVVNHHQMNVDTSSTEQVYRLHFFCLLVSLCLLQHVFYASFERCVRQMNVDRSSKTSFLLIRACCIFYQIVSEMPL